MTSQITQKTVTPLQAMKLGIMCHQSGKLVDAQNIYIKVLAAEPDNFDAQHLLGVLADQQGNSDLAVHLISKALQGQLQAESLTTRAEAYNNLGNAFMGTKQHQQAETAYRNAISIKSDYAEAYNNLGNLLHTGRRFAEAEAIFKQGLVYKADTAELHNNLGNTLLSLERLEEAKIHYEQAVVLMPDYAMAYSNLGNVLSILGCMDEAESACLKAIAINYNLSEAHYNLSLILFKCGKFNEAKQECETAIGINCNYHEAWNLLGTISARYNHFQKAAEAYRKSIELRPDYAEAYNNLGNALKDIGELEDAKQAFQNALLLKPDFSEAFSNLLLTLHYDENTSDQELFTEHRKWNEQYKPESMTCLLNSFEHNDKKIKIGFVSGDLGRHPVGYFIQALFANYNKNRFEFFCYSDRTAEDELTRTLRTGIDYWSVTAHLNNSQLAEIIRKDKIQILVDLAGHTAKNRLKTFLVKPAPVQITWMGYAGTTGLTSMDYIISDNHETPPETETFYTEKILRLPNSYICYTPPSYAPDVQQLPALAKKHITFGCFNNLSKIRPSTINLWCTLLKEIPGSHLLIKTNALSETNIANKYKAFFGHNGVDVNRITMSGYSPHEELLSFYNSIDIALDPFPYTGGLTTLEALYMGVPVITMAGTRFCSRHGLTYSHG